MTPDQLRDIMQYLMNCVQLDTNQNEECPSVIFNAPNETEMLKAGLDAEGVKRILTVPWWDEMVTDIIETPDMCESDDTPEQVLEFARDVVSEYIRKRFPLEDQ